MVIENLTQGISAINPILAQEIAKNPIIIYVFLAQLILKLIFYPIALYIAGKQNQKLWFIVLFIGLLILNDFAFFPIAYILINKYSTKLQYNNKNSKRKKSKNKK